jgi:hypothetical protein
MPLCFFRVVATAAFLILYAGHASAGENAAPPNPDFKFPAVLPGVALAAQKAGIPTSGFDAPSSRTELWPGDTVTALISLTEREATKQWLVTFTADALGEQEKKSARKQGMRLYTSSGREFSFDDAAAALDVRIVGPFKGGGANEANSAREAKDKKARLLVNSVFLGLGLDRTAAAWMKVRETNANRKEKITWKWAAGGGKFPSEKTAAVRKIGDALGVTEDDERAMTGSLPAFVEFFTIASHTPGLDDILLSVVEVPWWSIIVRGGKDPDVGFQFTGRERLIDPAQWNLPETAKVYAFTYILNLNQKPALACQMAVVEPRPPWLTSAGIVGLAAQRPDGKGPHLMIRLLAGKLGPAAAPP